MKLKFWKYDLKLIFLPFWTTCCVIVSSKSFEASIAATFFCRCLSRDVQCLRKAPHFYDPYFGVDESDDECVTLGRPTSN